MANLNMTAAQLTAVLAANAALYDTATTAIANVATLQSTVDGLETDIGDIQTAVTDIETALGGLIT